MGTVSDLYATLTRTPYVIPISDGSGSLNDWVDTFVNPMTTDQDLVVATIGGVPGRLGVGAIGDVLTVGSSGLVDWLPSGTAFVNPMTTSQDLIVGGLAGAPARLGVGSVGQVLTVGSGGIVDWETPAVTVTGANPSATIGLSAVNGVATTYMRSDAAPALSQSITPTWTGAHVFNLAPTIGSVGGVTGAINLKGLTSGTFTMSVNDAAGTWTAKWPATAGTNTYLLTTDGSGNLSWSAPTGGGSGTVNSGTATQFAYYPASSAAVSSTPTFTVSSAGRLSFQPTAVSSGVTSYITIQIPTDTALTAGTQAIGLWSKTGTRQWASNTSILGQSENVFEGPTYAFASSGGVITSAVTLFISGPPIAGTNATITRSWALGLGSGNILMGDSGSSCSIWQSSGAMTLVSQGTNGLQFSSDNNATVAARFVQTTGQFSILKSIASTSSSTGALVVTAGAGVGGDFNVGGGSGFGIGSTTTTWGNFAVSGTGASSLRMGHGAAPSSPVNGDFWTTTSALFGRINGTTITYGGGTVNSGTATRMAYYAATGTAISDTTTVTVGSTGRLTFTPTAITSGSTSYITITMPADTTLAAGTQAIGLNYTAATRQWASNTSIAGQAEIVLNRPTYSFASATGTITNAVLLYIDGPPIQGTNCTLTNTWSMQIANGHILMGSSTNICTIQQTTGSLLLTSSGTSGVQFSSDNNATVAARFVQTTGQFSILKNIASTTTATGSLIVAGGVGIAGAVFTGAAITTGAPSGGTAAAWKFGTVASVTPTAQNRTIELDVNGTRYFLTAKTTND